MISQKEIEQANQEIASWDNKKLTIAIAYMQWLQVNPSVAKEVFGYDYTKELSDDVIPLLWQVAIKRGIQLADVQKEIYAIAQESVDANTAKIKNDAEFKRVVAQKLQTSKRNEVIKYVIITVVVLGIGYVIYRFVFKGKLSIA